MQTEYFWTPIPGLELPEQLPGRLIVIEGTDGVGRSTQMQLLRNWLERRGVAVHDTGLTRGRLAGQDIQTAKQGHTMGRRTQCLFYATDFADRLETEIVPALRAGYVVVTDRYIYSLMARAAVRGMEQEWLRKLYGFALKPTLTVYLKISLSALLPRALAAGGFDFWESGMDYLAEETLYDAFMKHQTALLAQFEAMTQEYGFTVVDAGADIQHAFREVQRHVWPVVEDMVPAGSGAVDALHEPAYSPREERHEERRLLSDRVREVLAALLEESE
ncbi:MAG: thymidylate kinase [Armatimonadetes bacterium]|nr:thymidylate kinase [Armatimonadota bacterium]